LKIKLLSSFAHSLLSAKRRGFDITNSRLSELGIWSLVLRWNLFSGTSSWNDLATYRSRIETFRDDNTRTDPSSNQQFPKNLHLTSSKLLELGIWNLELSWKLVSGNCSQIGLAMYRSRTPKKELGASPEKRVRGKLQQFGTTRVRHCHSESAFHRVWNSNLVIPNETPDSPIGHMR
jgi:hypothetical protein